VNRFAGPMLRKLAETYRKDAAHKLRPFGQQSEKVAHLANTLADLWDQDAVPDALRKIGTKAQLEAVLRPVRTTTIETVGDPDQVWAAVAALDLPSGDLTEADQIDLLRREILLKPIPGFFPTPPILIDRMFVLADIRDGDRVLEPSAGRGDIAAAVRAIRKQVTLDVIEINVSLRRILEAQGYTIVATDFMTFYERRYDVILMNPPFENGQAMAHVRHAYDLLEPGGRLVAILPSGDLTMTVGKRKAFQDWLVSLETDHVMNYMNDRDAFRDSEKPTAVATHTLLIRKACISSEASFDESDPVDFLLREGTHLGRSGEFVHLGAYNPVSSLWKVRPYTAGANGDPSYGKLFFATSAQVIDWFREEPTVALTPDPEPKPRATAIDPSLLTLPSDFADILDQAAIADEMIAQRMPVQGEKKDLLYGSFMTLRPAMPMPDRLYRAHCAELLDRVVSGEDYQRPTRAELLAAIQKISLVVPTQDKAAALYARLFIELFPDLAFPELDMLKERFPGETDALREELMTEVGKKIDRDKPEPRAPGSPRPRDTDESKPDVSIREDVSLHEAIEKAVHFERICYRDSDHDTRYAAALAEAYYQRIAHLTRRVPYVNRLDITATEPEPTPALTSEPWTPRTQQMRLPW